MAEETESVRTEIEQPGLNRLGLALEVEQSDPSVTGMADGTSLFLQLDHVPSLSPIWNPALRKTVTGCAVMGFSATLRLANAVKTSWETTKVINQKKTSKSEKRGNCLSVQRLTYTAVVSGVKPF